MNNSLKLLIRTIFNSYHYPRLYEKRYFIKYIAGLTLLLSSSLASAGYETNVDNFNSIQDAIDAVENNGGGTVFFPAGTYTFSNTLVMKHLVYLRGEGVDTTILKYTGSTLAIDGTATISARKIFRIQDMTINGSASNGSAEGIQLAHNHRSNPLLLRVKINLFPHYGIHFTGDNWIVSFENIELDQNGRLTNNSTAVYKDTNVADLNAVTFDKCIIEGNGSSSSAAGGVFLQLGMRGINFRDCTIKGNFGTDQVYINGASGLYFTGLYLEADPRNPPNHAKVGLEIANSEGGVTDSRFACPQNITPDCDDAIQIKTGSIIGHERNVFTGDWTKHVDQ